MDGRMPSDGKSSHGLWPGELKMGRTERQKNDYGLHSQCPILL